MKHHLRPIALVLTTLLAGISTLAKAAETYESDCFKPFNSSTKVFEFKAKKPPYRIALANGFVGNTWRIEMIKSLQAYADSPEMKPLIKELRIVSTGTDVAAQIGAVDNFINAGYDAILINAVSPTAFKPVIQRAKRAGVLLVAFDNIINSDDVLLVNEDQVEMGRMCAKWLEKTMGPKGTILEVRGVPGNSVDQDRHKGFHEVLDQDKDIKTVEVVGNWDDGTAQKASADAIAVHGHFDGCYTQGGSTGTVRAFMDAKHPFIPVAGEAENGFRKLLAEHAKDGLKGFSVGQSPALSAISLKAAVALLQGNKLPQFISIPLPYVDDSTLKAGENYFPDLSDDFFVTTGFEPCGVKIDPAKLMGANKK